MFITKVGTEREREERQVQGEEKGDRARSPDDDDVVVVVGLAQSTEDDETSETQEEEEASNVKDDVQSEVVMFMVRTADISTLSKVVPLTVALGTSETGAVERERAEVRH